MNTDTVKTTYVHAAAIAAQAVGYLIAFVPAFGPDKQALIAGGGIVISAFILLAHAIRVRPTGTTPATAVQQDITTVVRSELAKLLTAAGQ